MHLDWVGQLLMLQDVCWYFPEGSWPGDERFDDVIVSWVVVVGSRKEWGWEWPQGPGEVVQVIQDCLVTAKGLGVRIKAANEAASPTTHAAVKIIQWKSTIIGKIWYQFCRNFGHLKHFGSWCPENQYCKAFSLEEIWNGKVIQYWKIWCDKIRVSQYLMKALIVAVRVLSTQKRPKKPSSSSTGKMPESLKIP